jgi:TatD DNase family protein
VIARAVAAGIAHILVPGYDLASSRAAVALAETHVGLIDAAVGIHPHHAAAASADADAWPELAALARHPGVVAIGEIGLDYFRNLSPPDVQRAAFARQLRLATEVRKPVLVHDRDAHRDMSEALLGWADPSSHRPRGVLHAFSGDAAMATRLASAGFLVSFALPVAFRSAVGPRAAAAALPEGSFLVETDAPWLAPGGGEARNEPTTALRVAAELARLRGQAPEQITRVVGEAYGRLVGG